MAEDWIGVALIAFLPVTALMLVVQVQPYHALVLRGVLGAVAVLVYVWCGAADVALTEALVGTLLSVTLYAVAVRSSLTMRLGVLAAARPAEEELAPLRAALQRVHLRLELVAEEAEPSLRAALLARELHGICLPAADGFAMQVRVPRLRRLLDEALEAGAVRLAEGGA